MEGGAWWAIVHKVTKSWSKESDVTEETQYAGNPFGKNGDMLHAVQEKEKNRTCGPWDRYTQGYFSLSYLAEKFGQSQENSLCGKN